MEDLISGFGQPSHLPVAVTVARLLIAAFLGAAIGFEREWHKHPAGIRTHILVCLAAATIALLAIEIAHDSDFGAAPVRIDPIRLIEAVTAGVAFLAAGFIVSARGGVQGLTTAAGMWLTGAVGLSAGWGFWRIAVIATLLGVIVLGVLRIVQDRFGLDPGDGPAGRGEDRRGPTDGRP